MSYFFSKTLGRCLSIRRIKHVTAALAAKGIWGPNDHRRAGNHEEKARRRFPTLHDPWRLQSRIRTQGAADRGHDWNDAACNVVVRSLARV